MARGEDSEGTDLNIIPFLDVIMNLILFVLVSMGGLVAFGTVRAEAAFGSRRAASNLQAPIVALTRSGFAVDGVAVAAGDFSGLTMALKAVHPADTRVLL